MDITVKLWSESAFLPLLTLMTLLPLATMFTLLVLDSEKFSAKLALTGIVLTGLLGCYVLLVYDPENSGIQLAEHVEFLGLSYYVGVDGANILFIPLTALITLLTLIYLQSTKYANDSAVLACLLGYETILLGAFSALNAMQFWLWSCLEIFPVAFLTLHTGTGAQRRHAVKILAQFWGGGLLMTFCGFLLLGAGLENLESSLCFDWLAFAQNEAPFMNETLIFILLMYGFAIRMPLFPFHAWLPLLAEQGSVATSGVFIVGLKLGVYAVIRFVLPLLPGVSEEWSGLVVSLGLLGIFYGAILALMQNNMRRLLAFAVVSHTGVLILGVFSFEVAGVEGSLLLCLAYGLATAGLLFSIGFIYEHTQTAYMSRLGGLFDGYIANGLLFLIATLSTMAMPGTPGFDAAHLLITGVVEKNGWIIALLIGIGNLLAAAFLLWAFQRVFLANSRRSVCVNHNTQTVRHEKLIMLIIGSVLITTGFYGAPWKAIVETATGTIGKYYYFHNAIYNEEWLNNTVTPPNEEFNELNAPAPENNEEHEPLTHDAEPEQGDVHDE